MTKSAEIKAKAYLLGFCKTAASCGVNPRFLLKIAAGVGRMPTMVREFFQAISKDPMADSTVYAGVKRFNEALRTAYSRHAAKITDKVAKGVLPPPRGTTVFSVPAAQRIAPAVASDVVNKHNDLFSAFSKIMDGSGIFPRGTKPESVLSSLQSTYSIPLNPLR